MNIVIIGAGLGGLTFGAFAARDGHRVTVYDKNSAPGGVAALLEHEGYYFEQGPLLMGDLLPGEPLYNTLQELDITLPTVRADRGIVMPDYEMWKPEEYAGPYWRRERLGELFPEKRENIDAYYKFYDDVMHVRYLSTLPQTLPNKLRLYAAFMRVLKYTKMTVQELTMHFFGDMRIAALYSAIFADFCADPDEVQGLGAVMLNFETAFDKRIPLQKNGKTYYPGYCYIEGGCQKLPEALADCIRDNGGQIVLNTVVERVLIEDGRAVGVRLADGTEHRADMVVGSGGGRDFFNKAVGREHLTKEYLQILDSYRPMEAVFMLHLGVDFDPLQYQREALCYYYGTYDLHAATERLRSGIYHKGDDGFLMFVPSDHAPQFAPEGKHCLTIYTIAPDTLAEGSWSEKKQEYAEYLIKLAEKYMPGLSEHITTMKIMTAEDYRAYTHMDKCSFGGVVPIWNQKNPTHITPVENLYFVGQQSENIGGVGNVVNGARDAYNKMKGRHKA